MMAVASYSSSAACEGAASGYRSADEAAYCYYIAGGLGDPHPVHLQERVRDASAAKASCETKLLARPRRSATTSRAPGSRAETG
ncbi:hypothetical protein SAMN04489730_6386 [Amycolatopsis australiensis]|uniref:Uncharacterized protein n=1 Tax=Amycolatopsis australiensis TaxID=546364 RepID=A0A1K1SRC5_9PSEU|nr:hypothetical protein SAMN04489730_6386 [Amycolatopsis australiensis]